MWPLEDTNCTVYGIQFRYIILSFTVWCVNLALSCAFPPLISAVHSCLLVIPRMRVLLQISYPYAQLGDLIKVSVGKEKRREILNLAFFLPL